MRSSVIFTNAKYSPVIDKNTLIAAMQKGKIHAAALNFFEREPFPVDSPLLSVASIVALPHIGSATHETCYGMVVCIVDKLINALQGKAIFNCVNFYIISTSMKT